ncbi:MAG: orotidine-5'-phosphate decarboxylase [Microcella sp.]
MTSFGERLRQAVTAHGRLCVGIDPHASLLADWGLSDDPRGVETFADAVIAAATNRVAALKPQVAFFERHGSAGLAVLERVIRRAREAGILVIADAKRGDIGSTLDGYAEAWLEQTSPLASDAMTVSAFQGVGSLAPAVERAARNGAGLFVLAATSNPESARVQTARDAEGRTVSALIADDVAGLGRDDAARGSWSSFGLVVGATVPLAAAGLDPAALPAVPVLAPGFGHQGARLGELDAHYGPLSPRTLASVSRSVLATGPDGLAAAIDRHRAELSA